MMYSSRYILLGMLLTATCLAKYKKLYISQSLTTNVAKVKQYAQVLGNVTVNGLISTHTISNIYSDTTQTGATGPTGFTGAEGNQGITGNTGNTGPQGARGFTGDRGIQGNTGFTGFTGFTGPDAESGGTDVLNFIPGQTTRYDSPNQINGPNDAITVAPFIPIVSQRILCWRMVEGFSDFGSQAVVLTFKIPEFLDVNQPITLQFPLIFSPALNPGNVRFIVQLGSFNDGAIINDTVNEYQTEDVNLPASSRIETTLITITVNQPVPLTPGKLAILTVKRIEPLVSPSFSATVLLTSPSIKYSKV
ncbi:MAG: collagen-like triple helix repeat-containing protein [Candidatus Dependentiae bacterium]